MPVPHKTLDIIVLFAGRGRRAGQGVPKTYRQYGGDIVARKTLQALLLHPVIRAIQPVIHADDHALYDMAIAPLPQDKLRPPVYGGDTRALSVQNGMRALATTPPDFVMIHDGARPNLNTALIDRLIEALKTHAGAIPILPQADALWRIDAKGTLMTPIPRDDLGRAQTPQAFHFAPYLDAISTADPHARDDAEVAHHAGIKITTLPGDDHNTKLTYPSDFDPN